MQSNFQMEMSRGEKDHVIDHVSSIQSHDGSQSSFFWSRIHRDIKMGGPEKDRFCQWYLIYSRAVDRLQCEVPVSETALGPGAIDDFSTSVFP